METGRRRRTAGPGIADEEGRDNQMQFIHEVFRQELGMHGAATLDHQPLHPARVEVLGDLVHVHLPAAVDDRRHVTESLPRQGQRPARAVDEPFGVARGEEVRALVELRLPGHRDLDRR